MGYVSIDFEYNKSKNRRLNLVCCSLSIGDEKVTYWLLNTPWDNLIAKLNQLKDEGYTFLAWNLVAEARCFLTLGLNPLDFKWIDLYLEYRCLTNHNHNYAYGKQLKKGREVYTKPPKNKWEITSEDEDDEEDNSKPEHNLVSGMFKVLGAHLDNNFKKAMRDILIYGSDEEIEANKVEISQYCESDTHWLIPALKAMGGEYKRLLGDGYSHKQLLSEMTVRAEYACLSAYMEREGYPINYEMTKNFSQQVPNILYRCQTEINSQFPNTFDKKRNYSYSWNQKNTRNKIRDYIKANPRTRWMLTDGGKSGKKDLSLKLKAFTKYFNFSHTYPKGNFFAQIIRYLKLKQNLNGFLPAKKNSSNFWDYVGDDNIVRPYMGIYTAQSSRSQPKATGFIPLKSAWMRTMISPKKGEAICGIDWSSVEFLIGALNSGDKQMLKDYQSGDVYLAFGKSSGYIPPKATKASHKTERNNCKPVILGLQFDMTKYGLSADLSEKWGRPVSVDEAETWVQKHKNTYPTFWDYKALVTQDYRVMRYIKLPCGWYMWGDNNNHRSVGNVPIQGMSASIMRKAVELAFKAGLTVIYTLHDAIYIKFKSSNLNPVSVLASCMDEAFRFYYPDSVKPLAMCRMEADVWSQDYEGIVERNIPYTTKFGTFDLPTKIVKEYIDERGKDELNSFSEYFQPVNMSDF